MALEAADYFKNRMRYCWEEYAWKYRSERAVKEDLRILSRANMHETLHEMA